MRILVVGGDGMLGHALLRAWRERHEVWATLRKDADAFPEPDLFPLSRCLPGVDVRNLDAVTAAIAAARPDAVVNAAGIVKQRPSAKDAIQSLEVNALFPHRLANLCAAAHCRLLHLSTDCVFSGRRGRYSELDPPDAEDLYGRSKVLGEVHDPHCLTLRTSMIGLELSRKSSLVEWFLAQRGIVRGFRRAIFTGFTTAELARAIEHLLVNDPRLSGVWHLAAEPISKLELLSGLRERLPWLSTEIVADDEFSCDRSLDGRALRARSAYRSPPWSAMLDELALEIDDRRRTA
jgi:dTDP-4-dehydrorhamnose reductase